MAAYLISDGGKVSLVEAPLFIQISLKFSLGSSTLSSYIFSLCTTYFPTHRKHDRMFNTFPMFYRGWPIFDCRLCVSEVSYDES